MHDSLIYGFHMTGQGCSNGWALEGIGPPTWEPGPAKSNEFFPTKRLYYRHKYSPPVRWMDYLGKGEMLINRDLNKCVNKI